MNVNNKPLFSVQQHWAEGLIGYITVIFNFYFLGGGGVYNSNFKMVFSMHLNDFQIRNHSRYFIVFPILSVYHFLCTIKFN